MAQQGSRGVSRVVALVIGALAARVVASAEDTTIRVLSNRADLVSGGDALVEVVLPAGVDPAGVVIDDDGRDVTSSFALRPNGRFMGVVTGLDVGSNVLTATLPGGGGARITIRNHPVEGPVFGGPHLQPWDCTTASQGLGAPDANCNTTPIVDWLYMPTGGTALAAYDPANPPTDVATTTTDQGKTVRYVVRRERGAVNRGLYAFAVLHDPAVSPEPRPWERQDGFNGKLYYPFGASCNVNQTQGAMPNVLSLTQLSRGFAVATTSLNVLGHHCNPVISAETAMMAKERVIEELGEIRFTISSGGSGGAIGQLQVANSYPGITNGLIPSAMFPDVWSTAIEVSDCAMTEFYWPKATPPWTPMQRSAVDGHGPPGTSCAAWVALFWPAAYPHRGCFSNSGLPTTSTPEPPPDGRDYFPILNPGGCRATINDLQVNIWGRRDDGFAKRPMDNVGVQYGLDALNAGTITFAHFLDLDAKIGGVDIDGMPTLDRTRTEEGVPATAYRSSNINDGRGLVEAAIINLPATANTEIHTPHHAYALEARLVANVGHADNHAIWHGGPGGAAFDTMDAWLTRVEADGRNVPRAQKVLDARILDGPYRTVDSCFVDGAQNVEDRSSCLANVYGAARTVAGMSRRHDVLKCTLKPVDLADYHPTLPLPPNALELLKSVFPDGVCDYSVPGVGQDTPSTPWLTYANGPGGEPLGAPPASTAF